MKTLEKAKKEGGILFHSPGSPTVKEQFAHPADEFTFDGKTHQPNSAVDFHHLPEQKAIEPHFNKIHGSPNFEESFKPGMYSKGENAKLVQTPHGQFLAKKSLPLHPADREEFGVDDRNFSQGERELAYHNAAHNFFGMGQHVPLAALANFPEKKEHWSMHKMVDTNKYHHGPTYKQNAVSPDEEKNRVKNAHNKGIMAKALVMDAVMGNHDRHDGNIFYGNHDLQLIDHGMSLSTKRRPHIPAYFYTNAEDYGIGKERIHPMFRDWLLDLTPENLNKTLSDSGVPEKERGAAIARLKMAKESMINATTRGNNYKKFFENLIHG